MQENLELGRGGATYWGSDLKHASATALIDGGGGDNDYDFAWSYREVDGRVDVRESFVKLRSIDELRLLLFLWC